MKTKTAGPILLFLILCLPSAAQANMGSPLVWMGALHLSIGNLVIGMLEGLILAKLFGLDKRSAMGWLILANYVSAAIGGALLLKGSAVRALHMDLYNVRAIFWTMVAVTYLMTLVIEFPFVALVLRGTADWLWKSLTASLIIQTITYVLLFGWYWLASDATLYTQNHVAKLSAMSLPKDVLVYFISDRDGDVYCRTLAGPRETRVCDLNSRDRNDRLFVRPSASGPKRWDLIARLETKVREKPRLVVIRRSFASQAAPTWRDAATHEYGHDGTWFNIGRVQRLGTARKSPWQFRCGFWAGEGLTVERSKSGEWFRFSLDTPFVSWMIRNATHLPMDKVLFQLGDDQICVFDPEARQVALVTRGRGPIAVMREESGRWRHGLPCPSSMGEPLANATTAGVPSWLAIALTGHDRHAWVAAPDRHDGEP